MIYVLDSAMPSPSFAGRSPLLHRKTGYITMREAINRIAAQRAPAADVREYLRPPYPGNLSETPDVHPIRWERAPEIDPFLRPLFATGTRLDAWEALQGARNELRHELAEGALTACILDAAGLLHHVPAPNWHTCAGHNLITTGTAGGFPVRDDPAFIKEATFAAWLWGRAPETSGPAGDPAAMPDTLTLWQASAWIMLRDPGAATRPPPDLAGLVAAWDHTGQGSDFDGALHEMLDCLRDGILPSWKRTSEGDTPIPSRRWRGMILALHGAEIAGFTALPPGHRGPPLVPLIVVHRAKLLALWPALPPAFTIIPAPILKASMHPSPTLAGITWLPFAAAVYRLAFGKSREPMVGRHDWGVPPDPWAVKALAARAAGIPWKPTERLPCPAYTYRKRVRQLMRKEEAERAGSGDPAQLLAYARQVTSSYAAWMVAVTGAEARVTAAVRNGSLPACGVMVDKPNANAGNGTHSRISPTLLTCPDRTIRVNGAMCLQGKDYNDFGPDGSGPYYVDIWVDAAALRRLHPAEPFPNVEYLPVWNVVVWRAFGAFGTHNLGSRLENFLEQQFPGETWDKHALRVGAWTALAVAERELKGLLLPGTAECFGRREAVEPDGQPTFRPGGDHERIQPQMFLNDLWAFDTSDCMFERRTGDYVTVRNGRPIERPLMFFGLRISSERLRRVWEEHQPEASALDDDDVPGVTTTTEQFLSAPAAQPLPAMGFISPYAAALWRAFGVFETPKELHPRSFDGGTLKLPDEEETVHIARVALHSRFDAAENDVRELLAAGRASATGREPVRTHSGQRLNEAKLEPVPIRAATFRSPRLAFAPRGELIVREATLARMFPPLDVRGTDADPSIPLYFEVLIPVVELSAAWDLESKSVLSLDDQSTAPKTVATEKKLTEWLTARMRAAPNISPGKPAIIDEAKAAGLSVSARGFARAWSNAVIQANAPAWSSPGRKSKQRIETPT